MTKNLLETKAQWEKHLETLTEQVMEKEKNLARQAWHNILKPFWLKHPNITSIYCGNFGYYEIMMWVTSLKEDKKEYIISFNIDEEGFKYECGEDFSWKNLGLSYAELKKLITILMLPSPYNVSSDDCISYLIQEHLFTGSKANSIEEVVG